MPEEILSQNEIDDLLSALSSGEMDANQLIEEESDKKVKVYDFKRALRFSKDQIRSISRIHDNFARLLTTYFSAQLRTYVHIAVASVDQIPYEEFIRSIPTKTILNVYSMEPLNGRIIFEFNPAIAYAMLDRLLGGTGQSVNKIDSLTEIETTLMSQLFERALESLQEAWESVITIHPILEEFEVNPQFLQLVSPNETVVVVSLESTIGDNSGMINICIPHVVLEPIIPKLSAHYWMQNAEIKERKPEEYKALSKEINKAELELTASLGEADISLEELLYLQEGDMILLNQEIEHALTLYVDQYPKFLVQPGKRKQKMAVQVLKEFKEGDKNEE